MQANKKIDQIMNKLDSKSYRMQLVKAARVFKSNWVEFGEFLTKVASEKSYREWGFQSFEEYCRVEIKIKKHTAIKLTNAYFFVTKTDPDIYKQFAEQGGPDLETVSVLQKAKNDENCSPDIYQELKESALEKGQAGVTLAKKFRAMTRAVDADFKKKDAKQPSLTLINRLHQEIKQMGNIPDQFEDYLIEMAEYFKKME